MSDRISRSDRTDPNIGSASTVYSEHLQSANPRCWRGSFFIKGLGTTISTALTFKILTAAAEKIAWRQFHWRPFRLLEAGRLRAFFRARSNRREMK